MGEEKRKYIRFECLLPAEVISLEGKELLSEEALVNDVSREGMKLVLNLDFEFKPGRDIALKLDLPEKHKSALVRGEIIWSRRQDNKWEVGLKIKDMDHEAKIEVLDYGYSKWLERSKDTPEPKVP